MQSTHKLKERPTGIGEPKQHVNLEKIERMAREKADLEAKPLRTAQESRRLGCLGLLLHLASGN